MSKRGRVADHGELAKMLKALAHPNRLRLFEEIRGAGETTLEQARRVIPRDAVSRSGGDRSGGAGHACFLTHVIERVKIGAPTVSHHLKELVNAGLVVTERQGKFVLCRIDPAGVEKLARFFADAADR